MINYNLLLELHVIRGSSGPLQLGLSENYNLLKLKQLHKLLFKTSKRIFLVIYEKNNTQFDWNFNISKACNEHIQILILKFITMEQNLVPGAQFHRAVILSGYWIKSCILHNQRTIH